jgi:putative membrane protein
MMSGAWNGSMMGPGMMWSYGAPGSVPNGGGWHGGMRLAGLLAALAFWGALVAGAILLVRWVLGPSEAAGSSSAGERPVAILRRRYAAGEIDRPTFERMEQELKA